MQRRQFIGAAAASALLPAVLTKPCLAAPGGPDYIFFDERFPQARQAIAPWPAASRLIGVQGDITRLWSNGLERMTRAQRLDLRGVTTNSFLFCLRILAGEHANLSAQVSRLDRDLLQWTLTTQPLATAGELHG
jgi:hypothetical protein